MEILGFLSLDQEQNPYCGIGDPVVFSACLASLTSYLLKPAFPIHLQEASSRLPATPPTTNHWSQIHICAYTCHNCVIVFPTRVQFSSSVLSNSATPWNAARQASLSTNSWTYSNFPSNHLILSHPLLPSVFPSIRGLFQWVSSSYQVATSIGVSAPASVLPMNIQDQFPLGLTDLIALQSRERSRIF